MGNSKINKGKKSSAAESFSGNDTSAESKIRELSSALESLKSKEEIFRSLYYTMTEGVAVHELILDGDGLPLDYLITDCNTSYTNITGIPKEKALNTPASKLYGTDKAPYIDIFYLTVKTGEPQSFDVYFAPMQKHFSISVVALKGNKFATIFSDITHRIKYENEIKKREKEFRELASNLPYVIARFDRDLKFLFTNSHIKEVTGFSSKSFIGKTIFEAGFSEELTALWDEKLRSVFSKGKSLIFEFDFAAPSGNLKFESHLIPELNSMNEIETVLSMTRDITQRKIYEEELIKAKDYAEEMNSIKSNFLANISHELRTPMVGILGFSEIIAQDTNDENTRKMAEMLYKSGKRLTNTLNQLLDLSRIEADRQIITHVKLNIPSCIRTAVRNNKIYADEKNLYLDFDCPDDNIFANLDEYMLNIILDNLICNAIKYTNKGGITITTYIEQINGADHCSVKIHDTGIGISKDKKEVIFDEFRQASEGYGRSFEGTGLGLTITKKFTEMLKGKLFLDSNLNDGTTVIVTFPAGIDENEACKEISGNSMSEKNDIKALKDILIVDDDDFTRDFIKALLNGLYNVDYAKNGEEALDKITLKKYSVILLDINLGTGIDGLEFLSLIRNNDKFREIPVIAVTAYTMSDEKKRFLKNGCNDYLSKPFEKKQLTGIIEKNLRD